MTTYVLEHKTSSEDIGLGSIYWRKLQLDAQISTYLVGARSLGYEPEGVVYDVLRKPALRPYDANSKRTTKEAPEAYRDRMLDDIASKPDYYYQRGVVQRLDSETADAAFDAWQTAEQIRLSRNAERWPRNVDACSMYSRMCDYWEVCTDVTTIDDPFKFERGEVHRELDGKAHLPLLTSSSARTYRSCPRKYQFAYEYGIRARAKAPALAFGTRIHAALEQWLLTKYDLEAALRAMIPPGSVYDFDAAKAEAMMRGYHARWGDEPLEVLAVEKEFQTELRNPQTGATSRTWLLGGKLDAVIRR